MGLASFLGHGTLVLIEGIGAFLDHGTKSQILQGGEGMLGGDRPLVMFLLTNLIGFGRQEMDKLGCALRSKNKEKFPLYRLFNFRSVFITVPRLLATIDYSYS